MDDSLGLSYCVRKFEGVSFIMILILNSKVQFRSKNYECSLPTAGNLSHGPTFCISGQLPVPVVTMHYGVIYGARSNDERERGGEPTVQKFNVNKTLIYKIN